MHTVGECHQTVAEMHIFHNDMRIVDTQVKVAEIPESADAERDQLIRKLLRSSFRNAEDSHLRMLLFTEFRKLLHGLDRKPRRFCTVEFLVSVEDPDQTAAALLKIQMRCDRLAEIARTDQDHAGAFIDTEDRTDDFTQFTDIVAVTLLTKTAEAVEILSNLGG